MTDIFTATGPIPVELDSLKRPALVAAACARFPGIPGPAWINGGVDGPAIAEAIRSGTVPQSVRILAAALPAVRAKLGTDPETPAPPAPPVPTGEDAIDRLADAVAARLGIGARGADKPKPVSAPGSDYIPPADLLAMAPVIDAAANNGERCNVMVTGPSGCGKTAGMSWLAAALGRPIFVQDASMALEPADWFGRTALVSGSTEWQWAPFAEAVETPRAIVVIDEANRADARVANGLLALTDHRGEAHPIGAPRPIRVAQGVIFALTCNIGAQYTGTERMDAALDARTTLRLPLTYPGTEDSVRLLRDKYRCKLADARSIVRAFEAVRALAGTPNATIPIPVEPASTRAMLAAGRALAAGADLPNAIRWTLTLAYSDRVIGTTSARAAVEAAVEAAVKGALTAKGGQ